ncbi:outer membrane beta-barrel family protein [Phocaeicola sp.]|uniref:outer membrane beta-barrel family protein n=1 Tax=Phocaeicola sp. TaxID=2773926 RepID=UPI0023BC9112|nr:outer membrane beta-barrel family protein [Phocaeicola sp.]MDE5676251.1 outer membrane beta-barrel family protein [Phocaeicola sp.]
MRDHTELDRLASDNIKSVEVINSPGARYAASVKAVVRITTKRIQGDGFGFSTRTNVSYNKEWGLLKQIGFNYRTGGFDLTGTLTGSDRRDWSKKDLIQQTRLDKQWRQEAYMDEKEHNQQLHSTLSANYVFSPKHAIGARYSFTRLPGYDSWGILNSDVYQDNQPEEQLASRYDSRDQQSKHLLNLYYKGQINDWEMDFNADMLQSKNRSDNHTHESIQTGATESTQKVNTHSEADNRLYAGKLVLSRSIAGGDFSIGGEYVRTLHQNEFNNAEAILKAANSEIRENSLSTFMEYSRNFGPLYLQAGIRFEHITSDYYEEGIKSETQSKHYNHWLPSATAMLAIGKVQLSLSYTSNILRPTYHELRPNIVYNNRYTYESGNPLLRPQLSQNLILNAIYHQIQFTAGYVHTRDAIVTASSLYAPDTPTIALLTTVNAPAYENVFASLSYSPTIRFWSPQFTASLFQQGFRADTPEGKRTLDTPLVNLSWDNSLQLPHHFLINADLSWHSTGHSENTEIVHSSWSAQLTFFKSWMNNRLSCQFRIHDLFSSTRTHTLTYLGALQTLNTYLPAQSHSVSLTVRYKFNAAKNKYKGTGAGEAQKSRM